jgi:lipoprotein signal peptidase
VRIFRLFLFDNIHGNYVFNFADVSILSGVFLLIYLILSSKRNKTVEDMVPQVVDDREDSN